MPTPATIASAKLADIAAEAREACAAELAKQADREEHPGEGWRAASWLTTHKVADAVAEVLMGPLSDLSGNSAAELAFFRAFSKGGSRELLQALLSEGQVVEVLTEALWPKFVGLAQPGAASASERRRRALAGGQPARVSEPMRTRRSAASELLVRDLSATRAASRLRRGGRPSGSGGAADGSFWSAAGGSGRIRW